MFNVIDISIKDHFNHFGVDPVVLGGFWNDPEGFSDAIEKAIESNIPYNESDALNPGEKF